MEIKSVRHLIVGIVLALLFGVNYLFPDTPFHQSVVSVLKNPDSPLSHLNLARLSSERNDRNVAREEFTIAASLMTKQNEERVAGYSTAFEEIEPLAFPEKTLRERIAYWERAVSEQPGYRDGYLRLAFYSYQLSDFSAASLHWKRAWELDPNSDLVSGVGKLIGVSAP